MKSFGLTHPHLGPSPFIQSCPFHIFYRDERNRAKIWNQISLWQKVGLGRIVADLASVNGEQIYAQKTVEYSIHKVKLGRSDIKDEAKHCRPVLDNVDTRVLACPSHEWSPQSVRLLKLWARHP
jgi:hypothetical protein